MANRFNPAPGWPKPPEGWTPPAGWQPDPSWPPAPEGWNFWIDDSAPAADAGAAAAGGQAAGGQAPDAGQPYSTGAAPDANQPYATGATPPVGSDAPTTQMPTADPGATASMSYPPAAAPYSGDPSTQPYATGQVPGSYAPGGTQPGAPDPNERKGVSRGAIIAIVVGGVLVLGLIIGLIAMLLSGGDDESEEDPTAEATSEVAEPTEEPTTEAPTTDAVEPTTDAAEPTTDAAEPTTDAPAPSGNTPVGYVEVALGAPYTATDFDGAAEANVTMNSITPGAECDGFGAAEGEFMLLDVTIAVPGDAAEPFSFSPSLELSFYNEVSELSGSIQGMFCTVESEIPSEIQPGAEVTGQVIVDVPLDAIWMTYLPNFGFSGSDGAAWAIP